MEAVKTKIIAGRNKLCKRSPVLFRFNRWPPVASRRSTFDIRLSPGECVSVLGKLPRSDALSYRVHDGRVGRTD
ncbi:hypothetical protein RRG08_006098 [Elysia crispata]|uniref:Uncharacterized protein n=1 Tax=Elysia crispata TaxID=231223 RepID=A0AAE1ABH8_9GAST|nr:hypothetical protein RRG08_006098 [Elysia crispata]